MPIRPMHDGRNASRGRFVGKAKRNSVSEVHTEEEPDKNRAKGILNQSLPNLT